MIYISTHKYLVYFKPKPKLANGWNFASILQCCMDCLQHLINTSSTTDRDYAHSYWIPLFLLSWVDENRADKLPFSHVIFQNYITRSFFSLWWRLVICVCLQQYRGSPATTELWVKVKPTSMWASKPNASLLYFSPYWGFPNVFRSDWDTFDLYFLYSYSYSYCCIQGIYSYAHK